MKDITTQPILKQEDDGLLVLVRDLATTIRVTAHAVPDLKEVYKNDNLAGRLRKEQPNRDLLLYK